ncbi:DNA adenine methylase [Desulfovibrio sp.]|uniref:DNA adenine methylase n=1 Tax=Desulfovibrio sp. TaxID=885 RepID=UPI0023C0620D|nr:DNA adenine methylase [Desulfovibrio sp.]MDE7242131.1 DNA adenine methylase [Desulfovibrio sp.]
MSKNILVSPIVKWVGGKRQLLPELLPLLPRRLVDYTYCEPFLGGGALLFAIQPKKAIVNDINFDLIGLYSVVRDDVESLISELQKFKNDSDSFYSVREWDRDKEYYNSLSLLKKSARLVYLNKTCYNGLFRVNNAGEFNTPFGNYKNPNIVNASILRAVNRYLTTNNVDFTSCDYTHVLKDLPRKSFVYLDPPYDPVSDTANFTGYTKGGFGKDAQIRLREQCDELDSRGIKFMLSNSATDFIKEQYSAYRIKVLPAKRNINSIGNKRGNVPEVVVTNYE